MGSGAFLPPLYDLLWTGAVLTAGVLPVALLTWAVLRALGTRVPTATAATSRARSHALTVDVVAWALLVLALVTGLVLVAAQPPDLRQGLRIGLVPAAAGILFALVHAGGELTWPRPTGTVRRAPLLRRTTADVAPAALRRALWGWAALLTVTVTACGLAADATGRAFPRSGADWSGATGPFPGWFYGLPILLTTLCVVLAAELALRLVARRPTVSDADPGWDLALRRLSAHRVLRGSQAVLGITAAGTLLVAGTAILNAGSGPVVNGVAHTSLPLQVLGVALLVAALASVIVTAVLAALPPDSGRTFPDPRPTAAGSGAGVTR